MKRKTKVLFLVLFMVPAFLFLHITKAGAIMVGLSTEELTRGSDVVVRGEVGNVETVWSEDGKSIVTRATIVGPSVIRGGLGQEPVIVEYPGGEIGDIGMKVSDVEPLQKGENVILFLTGKKNKERGVFHIFGKAQGRYTIGPDGIVRKKGFSLAAGAEKVDNNIPADELIEKIRRVR